MPDKTASVGRKVPDFSLPVTGGGNWKLSAARGSKVVVIDDFAHHPTAVRATIAAIRARFPGRRLWAAFEPRSNTSRPPQ